MRLRKKFFFDPRLSEAIGKGASERQRSAKNFAERPERSDG